MIRKTKIPHSIHNQAASKMEFKKIISGRNKVQILHLGFRMQRNQGPQGPLKTTYFNCTTKKCKATLATFGDLDGDLTLNYHRVENHNHSPDVSANIVSSLLHQFRDHIRSNQDTTMLASTQAPLVGRD